MQEEKQVLQLKILHKWTEIDAKWCREKLKEAHQRKWSNGKEKGQTLGYC